MYKSFIYIAIILLTAGGCKNTPEPVLTKNELTRVSSEGNYQFVNSRGEPVLLVSGQEITPEQIINKPANLGSLLITPGEYLEPIAQSMEIRDFKEKIKEPLQIIVSDKISEILLYNTAKKEIGDTLDESLDKMVEGDIRKFVQQFGGDEAKAEDAIKKNWHNRENYKKLLRTQILTQWYVSLQKTEIGFIPYRQLIRKYESMKDENFAITPEIEFRSIDILPANLEISDPNMDRRKYAEDFANELYTKLKSGENFAELAKQYSHGHRKQFGGLWEPINPNSLASPYDAIAKAALNMQPGEISQPIKTEPFIFIIKLEKKISAGYVPFEEVQKQVREAVIEEQNTNTAINKFNENVNQQMGRFETNAFIDFCLEKIYKESNQE
ncbi:MAG: peptidylprolyl isomerase [Sedimentisphaerales bacterium]|nr:peptidylprolyl isomerase [Sedimentisphaerales bacterium]